MGKKGFVSIALAVVVFLSTILGITACGPKHSSEETDGGSGKKEIRMWTFLDPAKESGREMALRQMIENFEEENNVDIIVEAQAWDTLTAKFMAAHTSGNAPDIIWVNSEDMGAILEMDALEPFENLFMKEWTEEEIEDVSDRFWDYGADDGKHYQMGFSRNYVGVMYRKDLLEEAGYEVPFKNWDEFRQAAKDLTAEKDETTGVARYGFGTPMSAVKSNPIIISNMLLKDYGTLFNEDGTAEWANETGLKAVELMKNMMEEDKSIPETCISTNIDDLCTDFAAGKYAMITGPSTRIEKAQAECVFDPETIGIMPYPSDEEGVPSPAAITGWCVGVWSGSKEKEMAGEFVEYMFSPEADQLWVELGGQVPMRKSTLERCKDFLSDPSKQFIVDSQECLTNAAWANPTEYTVTGWRDDQAQVMQDVLVNHMDPMEALEKAEKTFNERNGR